MDGVVMDFLLSDAIFGELRKQFGESRAAHAFPVSYTHLTLPTIA